jgi:hypothetical protein
LCSVAQFSLIKPFDPRPPEFHANVIVPHEL